MKKQWALVAISVALCLVGLGSSGIVYLYRQQKKVTEVLQAVHKELARTRRQLQGVNKQIQTQEVASAPVRSGWIDVQRNVEDAVVQVFTQMSQINWLEPYKAPDEVMSAGSGFFINNKGDLVTNYHVISQATKIQIRLPSLGQERFTVEIVGACPDRDIALLRLPDDVKEKIEKRLGSIPYLMLGDSDKVGRTQEVMALGFPLGTLSLKSTIGNVSGWQRFGSQSFIQLTSAINPGNSGGPALNGNCEVIGINTAAIPSAQNTGFFIPITELKNALKDLYKVKLLRKPVLGANFSIYPDKVREYLGNPEGGGWYVTRVFKGTLLEKSGVKDGDVLYSINGHELDMYGDVEVSWATDSKVSVLDLLNRYIMGDTLHLVLYRKGARRDVTVELDAGFVLPIRKMYPDFEEIEYEIFGGMIVMPLNLNVINAILEADASLAPYLTQYALPENQYNTALIVTHIFTNSPIKEAKLIGVGSIIDQVNGKKVRTLQEFRRAVANGKQQEFMTFTTVHERTFAAIALDDVREEEPELAARYGFALSESFKSIK